jgi:ubiquinone/menaquinone biosynthesis C-methylase UbiE
MAEDARRHMLRATFDTAAEGYEERRPVPPAEVFDDLVELAQLPPGARMLEIGCGTGQATLPLAERGFSILAVELGANLANIAREKLAAFPHVEVATSSFEEWDPESQLFDAVVAFNSFHWIDPALRFLKTAAVLRPGGSLAVLGSSFVDHDDADPVWLGIDDDYVAVTGEGEPRRIHLREMKDRTADFVDSGCFDDVTRKTYLWDLSYDTYEYLALLGTFSWLRALAHEVRGELLERIGRRIDANGGVVRPTWGAVLYVARRSSTLAVRESPA